MIRKEKGITLIALVVTIVVLLILAGVSISLVLGENGLITKAKETKIAQAHAQVKDAIALEYLDYQAEMLTAKEGETREVAKLASLKVAAVDADNTSFLNFLVSKQIANENGVIDVEELLGIDLEFGNGTGTSDVYKVEKTSENYTLKYYDKEGTPTLLDTYSGDIASKPADKTALKFLVNSGDDKIVQLPIDVNNHGEGGYEVDWGDGTTGTDATPANSDSGILHTYAESNKEYTVTITGVCRKINSDWMYYESTEDYEYDYYEKIIEVLQWGETGLEEVFLGACENLRKIASPTANSFKNVTNFSETFAYCKSLTSIPADLFAHCPEVTNFSWAFDCCSSLRNIPADLFAHCPNVTSFRSTFSECTGLTGAAPELWKRVTFDSNATEEDKSNYIGTPEGGGCFEGCEGLSNYEEIPDYWKIISPK